MTAPATKEKGRGWAYVGAVLGGGVSIAANIAHSYIPPTHAPADWSPEPGAVIGSVFWPIALFVAVEILTRIPWPTGKGWSMLRFGGLLPVALVAAVVSYRHLSGLLDHYGEDSLTVTIGPLAVDGLMTMATGALLAIALNTARDNEDQAVTPEAPAPTPTIESASVAPLIEPTEPAPAPEPVPGEQLHEEPTAPTLKPFRLMPPPAATRVNGHDTAGVSS